MCQQDRDYWVWRQLCVWICEVWGSQCTLHWSKTVQVQITCFSINKGSSGRVSVLPHPFQCPMCGQRRVRGSLKYSFPSSTDSGRHWCLPTHMCHFQTSNPQTPRQSHWLQGETNFVTCSPCTEESYKDVILSAPSQRPGVTLMSSMAINPTLLACASIRSWAWGQWVCLIRLFIPSLITSCMAESVSGYLESFVPLHRLREPGPFASTAVSLKH